MQVLHFWAFLKNLKVARLSMPSEQHPIHVYFNWNIHKKTPRTTNSDSREDEKSLPILTSHTGNIRICRFPFRTPSAVPYPKAESRRMNPNSTKMPSTALPSTLPSRTDTHYLLFHHAPPVSTTPIFSVVEQPVKTVGHAMVNWLH